MIFLFFLCWKFLGNEDFPNCFLKLYKGEMKREMDVPISLQFPRENCPFPLNFYAKTIKKFFITKIVI